MSLLRTLQPFVAPDGARQTHPRCELCGAPLGAEHSHIADVELRSFICSCRGCALLFTRTGAAGGRLRTIPDRHLCDDDFSLSDEEWDSLGIPVSIAFFFKSSVAAGWTAVYPSPAGPVESLLRLEAWGAVAARTLLTDEAEPDVEALLVASATYGFECMLVPIHACYALVGQIRRRWRGLDGGEEVRGAIAQHLARLRARCDSIAGELP